MSVMAIWRRQGMLGDGDGDGDDFDCPDGYSEHNGNCYRDRSWNWWGRWVLGAVIVVMIIAALFVLGCINSRRRRRAGQRPFYGTGWMAPDSKYGPQAPPGGYAAPPYGPHSPPPPQYSAYPQQPQTTGTTFHTSEGYYGAGPHQDIPLQQPSHTHQPQDRRVSGDNDVYAPPPGPPPFKVKPSDP